MGDGDTAGGPEVITDDMTPQRGSNALNETITETTATDTGGTASSSGSGDTSPTTGNTQNTGNNQSGAESVEQGNVYSESAESTGTRVSRGDAMELLSDEYSLHEPGEFSEVDPLDNTPTPHDFAEMYLPDGAEARHIAMGYDGRITRIEADDISEATKVGGWKGFDTDAVIHRMPIDGGRTDDYMEVVGIKDESINAEKAFVTKYDNDGKGALRGVPHKRNARSQLGVHSALDAMGVRTPRHTFNTETMEMTVEQVGGPNTDAVSLGDYHPTSDANDAAPDEYLEKVDVEQFETIMAANLICGNGDLTPDNIMIDENGNAVPFDYDVTESWGSIDECESRWGRGIDDTIYILNEAIDGGFDSSVEDVLDRAEGLAKQLKESGMKERVIDAVKEYDTFFNMQSDDDFATETTRQPDDIETQVNRHIELWSREKDDS